MNAEIKDEMRFSNEKEFSVADVMAMLPSSKIIEANGAEGGLREWELQLYWEGAVWLQDFLKERLISKSKQNKTNKL